MQAVTSQAQRVQIPHDDAVLQGNLVIPAEALGIILFAHAGDPLNDQSLAEQLNGHGWATLVFDLLTPEEELRDRHRLELRFDIPSLSKRLMEASAWIAHQAWAGGLPMGCFGLGTGAAVALRASIYKPAWIHAVVCRGGRPDLILPMLSEVTAPTLFIVGETDDVVLDLNRQALLLLPEETPKALRVVPGSENFYRHETAELAHEWFGQWLKESG